MGDVFGIIGLSDRGIIRLTITFEVVKRRLLHGCFNGSNVNATYRIHSCISPTCRNGNAFTDSGRRRTTCDGISRRRRSRSVWSSDFRTGCAVVIRRSHLKIKFPRLYGSATNLKGKKKNLVGECSSLIYLMGRHGRSQYI